MAAEVLRIDAMQGTSMRVVDEVGRLATDVSRLWPITQMASLAVAETGSHQTYISGTGPAMRASIMDDLQDNYNSRFQELEDTSHNLQASVVETVGTLSEQQEKITNHEDEVHAKYVSRALEPNADGSKYTIQHWNSKREKNSR